MSKFTIEVHCDEDELTAEQQVIAEQSDVDLRVDHPATKGCENLHDTVKRYLEEVFIGEFNYLKDGLKAITLRMKG